MTDLQEAMALLDKLEISYIYYDKNFAQGNESSLIVLILTQYGSEYVQKWFFYNSVGGKQGDKGKKKGDYYSTDHGLLKEKYNPPDDENEANIYNQKIV